MPCACGYLIGSAGEWIGILVLVLIVFLGLLGDIWCWSHTPCPKCGKRVKPGDPKRNGGVVGNPCPSCGTWFSADTWDEAQRDADPDF